MMLMDTAQPVDVKLVISGFLANNPAPSNREVLALAKLLRSPFLDRPALDQFAWASLGYYKPGDKFHIDEDHLARPWTADFRLADALATWVASTPPHSKTGRVQLTTDNVRQEALHWWERLKLARAGNVDAVLPASLTRDDGKRGWWLIPVTGLGVGLVLAFLISRRR